MRLVPALNCVIIFADMLIALSLHAQGTNEGSDLVSNTSEQEVINYGICARTPQVRDEILDQINGVRDCGLVTVADLPSITTLSLNNSGITTLQADDFSGLSSLATLRLKDNSLSTLPAGVFSGLTSLTRLDLRGNPGSPFTLTLQLDRIDDADDTASGPATVVVKVSEGAPFDMTVDLSVMGGTLSSSSLTIAKGSTQSGSITVTQSGMGQATVSLNVAPALPNNYRGIQTAVGNPLVLFERAVQNRGFFLSLDLDGSEGDQAVQSLAVPPPSGNQIISIQIFGIDIQNAFGLSARFEYDVTQVIYEGFDAGDVLPNPAVFPEEGPGFVVINITSWSGGFATVNSGLMGTLYFRTTDTFGGTKIQLVHAEVGRNNQFESPRSTANFDLEISKTPSPDVDENGMVDVGDFLLFVEHFGASRGHEAFSNRFDLNGNGKIDFSDFSILTNNFGKAVPVAVGTLASVTLGNDPLTVDISGNFSDANGDVLHYSAVSSANTIAMASVVGSEVTVSPVNVGSATITVIATNAGGLSATQDIAVTVQSAMGFAASRTRRAVDENTPPGEKVGDPVAMMSFGSRTYRLSGTDAELFVIDSSSGQIRTREGVTYNYEGKKTYWVRVVMMDQQYRDLDNIIVTITLNDVDEPPSSPPSNFLVIPDNESLTVHFSAVSDEQDRPPVRGYQAEIRRGENGPWGTRKTIYGRTNTSVYYHHIDPEGYHSRILFNGKLYQVRVRTYNSEGASDWSALVSGTPVYVPSKKRSELAQFQDEGDIEQTVVSLSDITGEGGKIIVPRASLPATISQEEVEGVFSEIVEVDVSDAPDVPAHIGFTITPSSSLFDIKLKARFNNRNVDIGDALMEPVEICLPVPAGISMPVIFFYHGDEWKIPENQRVDRKNICAQVDRFSLFGVGEEAEAITRLILELDRIDNTDDTAPGPATIVVKITPGMPFDMTVGLSVTGGTLSPSAIVTIAKGSTQSGAITVTQTGIGQATVSLGAAPALPANYRGLPITMGNPLVLFDIAVPAEICDRTTQVQTAILSEIKGVSDCGLTTSTHLSSVTTLSLNKSGITTLQADDFSGLSSLETIRLKDNSLSTLPAGLFSGLSSLRRLDLRGNPGSNFLLTLQLDRIDDTDDTASGPATIVVKVSEGAPFDMTVGLSVSGGTLSPSGNVTIAKGSTQSSDITVTQSGMGQATVSLDAAPAVPEGYGAIQTAVGNPLVLFTSSRISFGSAKIADQTYKQDSAITALVLPTATGGTAPITYALSPETNSTPDLPTGLSFDANTHTISGTPSAAFPTTTFTWTATDADNNTAELMFDITVPTGICDRITQVRDEILDQINGVNDCGLVTIAHLASITTLSLSNSGIAALQADDFSGLSSLEILRLRDNDLSALPAGLFSGLSSLRRLDLRGNPGSNFPLTLQLDRNDDADDTASGPATIVVKVSEGAPFDMTVGLSVTGGTLSPSGNVTIAKGSTQSSDITVTQSGMGQATVSLDAAPAVPEGYRGIQTAVGNPLVLFTSSRISFGSAKISDQTYKLNSAITNLVLPTATGGTAPITYALSPETNSTPDLPTGLSFDANTHTISGTPSAAFPTTTFTWTATDADNNTAELMFDITVPTGICDRTTQVRDEILDQINGVNDCGLVTIAHLASITTLSLSNSGIAALQADDFSGLSSLETIRLKDNSLSTLPAGLFSGLSSLRRLDLRGNPGSDFTLTLQLDRIDNTDDTASGPATIVVKVSEGAPFDMTVGLSVTGGTLSPSGNVTIAKGSTQSGAITVMQSGMDQATVSLDAAPALPEFYRGIQTAVGNPLVLFTSSGISFGSATISDQTYKLNSAITNLVLPTATGGTAPITYALSPETNSTPDLPTGLSFDANTHTISGIPSAVFPTTTFTWTATDADNDTAELMFDITVPAGICARTTQVRDEILDQIDGVSDCGLVTSTHLSSVETLSLNNSGITSLKSDDFSGLSSLATLRLKDNSLSTLPAGVFSGLTSLTRLDLRGNPGSPFTLTLQLDRTDDTDDTASGPATVVVKVSEGAPFDMTVSLSVTGGTLSPSANVTIAKGSTQSGDITVTQSGMGQATVSLDAAPALPTGDNVSYRGIQAAVGSPLVLFEAPNRAPVKVGTIAAQTLTEGAAAVTVDVSSNFSDPENDPLTYSATSDDTNIATVSVQNSVVTISPVGAGSATITVTALDATGSNMSVDQTIAVTVNPAGLSFGSATIADQTYKLNSAITNLVLPTATGGTVPITYALSPETNDTPNLPAGLSFDANTRTISGTPSAIFSTTTFTWTATDADNDTAELMFDITVPAGICARTTQVRDEILDQIDGVSDCGLVTVADLSSITTLSLNHSDPDPKITTLQSADFSGLSSLETLRLRNNSLSTLPAGVFSGLTSLTRLDLRGNPGSDFTLTLQLDRTDDADDTASGPATIVVKVAEGAPFDMTVSLSVTGGTLSPSANVTIAKGSTQSGDITVTQSGMGQATVSLDAAPALPTGDNVSYRGIQAAVGSPLVLFEAPNRAPVKVGTIAAQTLTEGAAAVTVDVSSNFSDPENDPLTYSATSDDTNIATVSVQNSVVTISPVGAGSATITVTALDATGSNMSVDQTIAVTVNPAGLSFGSATIADQTYKLNSAITNLVLPTATGGTVPITYALSPETNDTPNLPAGLSFDANTRTISGTPSAIFSTTTFTWTATDADNDTAELMFDITVPAGICARTTQVRDEILDQIDGVSDCGLVTVADLSSITTLSLNHSDPDPKITTLQSADFSGLSSLETLRLRNNSLSTLPAGVFSGLTSLTRLDLRGNPGSDFTLTLQLDRTDDADDTASGPATIVVKVAEGAPFDMTVSLSVSGGTLSPSNSVTIAKGSTQSSDITVTQSGMGQATVSLDAAPALPIGDNVSYRGIQTAVGNPLVLFEAPNGAPEKVGTIAAQTLTEGTTAVTVDVSSNFSDPENDPLTYSAASDDENVATVSVQGSMVTISPVGAGSAMVTVTALDATGSNMSVDQTIAVTVNPLGICSRTTQVRDEILDQIDGVSDCGLVTIAHLSSITTLSLNHSDPDPKITTLQSADFSGLSSLETLRLRNNSLSTLPAGVFSGLTSLTRVDLRGNPGSPFTLTLQLDRTDDTDDTASGPATIVVKVAEGAPFDMTVGLSVTGGTLSSSSVTIAKGSTQSGDITVTGTGQVTVSLGAAPAVPSGYRSIQTAVGNALVLF